MEHTAPHFSQAGMGVPIPRLEFRVDTPCLRQHVAFTRQCPWVRRATPAKTPRQGQNASTWVKLLRQAVCGQLTQSLLGRRAGDCQYPVVGSSPGENRLPRSLLIRLCNPTSQAMPEGVTQQPDTASQDMGGMPAYPVKAMAAV